MNMHEHASRRKGSRNGQPFVVTWLTEPTQSTWHLPKIEDTSKQWFASFHVHSFIRHSAKYIRVTSRWFGGDIRWVDKEMSKQYKAIVAARKQPFFMLHFSGILLELDLETMRSFSHLLWRSWHGGSLKKLDRPSFPAAKIIPPSHWASPRQTTVQVATTSSLEDCKPNNLAWCWSPNLVNLEFLQQYIYIYISLTS